MIGPRLAAYAVCETGLLVEGGNIRLMAIVCVDGLDAVGEGYQNQAKGEIQNRELRKSSERQKIAKCSNSGGARERNI